MARNFASLALARLYEKQGYLYDALETYRAIDISQCPDAQSILETISRLESRQKTDAASRKENLKESNREVLTPGQAGTKETGMAHLLEVWLKLIVMQKRVDIFKSIKARL